MDQAVITELLAQAVRAAVTVFNAEMALASAGPGIRDAD